MATSCAAAKRLVAKNAASTRAQASSGAKERSSSPTTLTAWSGTIHARRLRARSSVGASTNLSAQGSARSDESPISSSETPASLIFTGSAWVKKPNGRPCAR